MARGVTVITGASAGLGVEFARQCRKRGEEIVLVARRRDRLEALAAELGSAHVVAVDLARPGGPAQMISEVAGLGLEIDILINNAGFGVTGRFDSAPSERLLEIIDLNVRALTETCRLVLPVMVERERGAILNVASTAAFQAGPNMAVYYASKAYVLSFTEALHHELKGTGIKVSALCPGPTTSEFSDVAESHSPTLERMKMPAAPVVAAGLAGLDANKAVVIPGLKNKIGAQASRFLTRAAMRRIIGRIKV
jgi:short-subunit dehydrogenase